MKAKKSKKKVVLALLLVLSIAGVVGYGVYSYYWAEGTMTNSSTLTIDGFNVTMYGGFVGQNSEIGLECQHSSGEIFICTGSYNINNLGTKDVEITISNINTDLSGYDNASITDVNIGCDGFTFEDNVYTRTISPRSEVYCYPEVEIQVDGYEPEDDVEVAKEVTSPILGGELELNLSYDVRATEVHE